uniref:Uncharacterized protein n=1 Tax=Romanomermis culicivorax TaxID=13658 RepID=A0A915HT44_ROMCU
MNVLVQYYNRRFDFLRGLGFTMAGAIRIGFMINNSDEVLIPRAHCMFQVYQTAQMIGQTVGRKVFFG